MNGKDEALPLEWIDPSVLEVLRKDGESLDYRDPFGKTLPAYQGRYMAAVYSDERTFLGGRRRK